MENNNDFIENNENEIDDNKQSDSSSKKKKIIISVVAVVVVAAVIITAVMLNNDKKAENTGSQTSENASQSQTVNQEDVTVAPGDYAIIDSDSLNNGASTDENTTNSGSSSGGSQNSSQSGGNTGSSSDADDNSQNNENSGDSEEDEKPVSRNVTAYITLPSEGSASDTLEIYVNGELQKFGDESGISVKLNGDTVKFTTEKKYEGVVRVEAKLKSYGTSASQITTEKGDQISFSLPLNRSEENFGQLD